MICPTPTKLCFCSRREALTTTRNVGRRGKVTPAPLRPYRCVCGFWHLTSMSSADLRRVRKLRRAAA